MSVVAEAGAAGRAADLPVTSPIPRDDLSREVYCVSDSVDAIEMAATLDALTPRGCEAPYLISTPNLNFLVKSLSDDEFRESLIASDLCTADGSANRLDRQVSWNSDQERVAGSDFLEALTRREEQRAPEAVSFRWLRVASRRPPARR
jgi:N-acetylglucosaminyldiphosphoundecaprenol N-acetyl-beta-D-mannosaminyltransferase